MQYLTDVANLLELLRLVPGVQDALDAPVIPLLSRLTTDPTEDGSGSGVDRGASIEFEGA